MKKTISVLMGLSMLVIIAAGCAKKAEEPAMPPAPPPMETVTETPPAQ